MIVSLQKKFILISALSIFVVFSGIFLVLVYFSNRQLDRTMDTLADAISSNDGVFPEFDPAQHTQPFPYDDVINEETRYSTRFFYRMGRRGGAHHPHQHRLGLLHC